MMLIIHFFNGFSCGDNRWKEWELFWRGFLLGLKNRHSDKFYRRRHYLFGFTKLLDRQKSSSFEDKKA